MSTNFYYKIPIKKEDIEKLHKMVNKLENAIDFYQIKDKLNKLERNSNIHLGKRSAGWQFIWDYHRKKFYDTNLESIKNFLENSGGIIEDEYHNKYTIDEFFNDEITYCLYKGEKTSYCNEFLSEDGLRFSEDENFC